MPRCLRVLVVPAYLSDSLVSQRDLRHTNRRGPRPHAPYHIGAAWPGEMFYEYYEIRGIKRGICPMFCIYLSIQIGYRIWAATSAEVCNPTHGGINCANFDRLRAPL